MHIIIFYYITILLNYNPEKEKKSKPQPQLQPQLQPQPQQPKVNPYERKNTNPVYQKYRKDYIAKD